ncbi:hypothetical protein [Natrialba asiatica]|nr:hypothetical protein [Natrialba asiatica]
MVAQIRDKIASMANWTLTEESTAGTDAFSSSDWAVFETPTGSYVRLAIVSDQELELSHGLEWDTENSSWSDQYSNSWSCFPVNGDNYQSASMDSQVRWWIEYVDGKGFAFVATREEGDGLDEAMAMGFSELTRLWDYTTAQVRESKYTALVVGHKEDEYGDRITQFSATFEGGASSGTYHGKGEVNADGNNDNYPMVETTLQGGAKYEDALIGEHDLWIQDDSGDRSAHLDTVTDGGADKFTIFKEGLPSPVGIRMD